MSRQDQQIGWKDLPEPLARSDPFSQRVGVGLRGLNAHIRCDFWENLVTGDDDLQFWAIEADVFWSVAVPNEGSPFSSIDVEVLTILNSAISRRQRRNARTKLTEPFSIAR